MAEVTVDLVNPFLEAAGYGPAKVDTRTRPDGRTMHSVALRGRGVVGRFIEQ
jgi:hypothetical protein